MASHLTRGMAYATVEYFGGMLPCVMSGNAPASPPIVDVTIELSCEGIITINDSVPGTKVVESPAVTVRKEVQLHFRNSDFTWIIFFSRPARVTCLVARALEGPGVIPPTMFRMSVVEDVESEGVEGAPRIVRAALLN
mmetsp:Transcript_57156/g.68344  ORF Transcript_57156/g.68344 Transcript_57156/m.68344 type:complete len:138 (-) Transcript_57156:1049-1462(-)